MSDGRVGTGQSIKDPELARAFLLFYLFETWEKLLQVDAFVCAPEHRRSRRKRAVMGHFHDVLGQLDRELDAATVPYCLSLLAGGELVFDDFVQVVGRVRDAFKSLKRIHGRLNLLAGTGKGENQITYDFVRKMAEDTRGTLAKDSSWLPYVPAVALTDEYSFMEHDLRRILSSDLKGCGFRPLSPRGQDVILALPKAESENPLMWATLAHEIAHTMIDNHGIVREILAATPGFDEVEKLDQQRYQNWCSEICADLIALRLLGPSYFFSFASAGFVLSSVSGSSHSHPSVAVRVGIMERVIEKYYYPAWAIECQSEGEKALTNKGLIPFFSGLLDSKWNLWAEVNGLVEDHSPIKDQQGAKLHIDKDIIVEVLDRVLVPVAELAPPGLLSEIFKDLKEGRPISTQRDQAFDTKEFQEKLAAAKTAPELYQSLPQPESPLTLSTILSCGWMLKIYVNYAKLLTLMDKHGSLWKVRDAYAEIIDRRNRILQNSLNRAFMTQMYWKWRKTDEPSTE